MGDKRTKLPTEKHVFSTGVFAAFSAAAVVLAVLMATLSNVSVNSNSKPTTKPTSTPTTSTPKPSTPAIFIQGKSKGLPTAPITIVEYSDFQCAHCQEFALTTEKELDKDIESGKVRLVFKQFIVFGDKSMVAAMAAESAAEQNQFWPYRDLLMGLHLSPTDEDLTIAKLESLAQQLGLNTEQFNTSLESGKYKDAVLKDDTEGRDLGVTATPTFLVNGFKAEGATALLEYLKTLGITLTEPTNDG